MTGKKGNHYKAVFKYINENVFDLEPASIITDFEAGMRNAIETVYPASILKGCWFHFKRAIRQKCRKEGLHAISKSYPEAKLIENALMNIPLLPQASIEQGYMEVKQMANEIRLKSKFKGVFAYFENYWLDQVRINLKKIIQIIQLFLFISNYRMISIQFRLPISTTERFRHPNHFMLNLADHFQHMEVFSNLLSV